MNSYSSSIFAVTAHKKCISVAFGFEALSVCRLLPLANDVWDKVICIHLSVILSTGGGVPGPGVCVVRGVPGGDPPGRHSCSLIFVAFAYFA